MYRAAGFRQACQECGYLAWGDGRGGRSPSGYLLYSGEQHGFRKAENSKRSLDAELYFYAVNVFRTGLSF